jgi:hypothetical protein
MVSPATLKNVGVCAAVSGMTLTSADGETARFVIEELRDAALARLNAEARLSQMAVDDGADVAGQLEIVEAWTDWYVSAIEAAEDIELGGSSAETISVIQMAQEAVRDRGSAINTSLAGN